MRILAKLITYAAVLLVVLGAAYFIGRTSGIDGLAAADEVHDDGGDTHAEADGEPAADGHADQAHATGEPAGQPGGLQVTADGYTLEPLSYPTEPGREEPFEFRIVGPDGTAITDFTTEHDADLHLIVVNRDLSDYQHVHPTLSADGTWSVPLTLAGAGAYRAFADFAPAGADDGLTLGADLLVAGRYEPSPLPAPARTAEVDGYTVELAGRLEPGTDSPVTLTVSRDGEPVTDLEPYLGAYGHLVALRERDLAYLHVHPDGDPGDPSVRPGPEVGFVTEVPSEAAYRLYFEFQHEGTVRRAEFTVEASHDH
ncbi:MAG TPA: hypothetical protein VFZ85_00635 [Jiangellaceae bacterium]